MQAIGVRELKARLSRYLRMAREGEVVLVTDRGTVIAELRPHAAPETVPAELRGLWELGQQGGVRLGSLHRGGAGRLSGRVRRRPTRRLPDGTAERLLDADRAERSVSTGADDAGSRPPEPPSGATG
ncbi:MAG: hypothetical protein HMLKMBBP_00842 [Planctomycetes bacterium]|nr:hypothetical protein [Planctomycetota bacterium]